MLNSQSGVEAKANAAAQAARCDQDEALKISCSMYFFIKGHKSARKPSPLSHQQSSRYIARREVGIHKKCFCI